MTGGHYSAEAVSQTWQQQYYSWTITPRADPGKMRLLRDKLAHPLVIWVAAQAAGMRGGHSGHGC